MAEEDFLGSWTRRYWDDRTTGPRSGSQTSLHNGGSDYTVTYDLGRRHCKGRSESCPSLGLFFTPFAVLAFQKVHPRVQPFCFLVAIQSHPSLNRFVILPVYSFFIFFPSIRIHLGKRCSLAKICRPTLRVLSTKNVRLVLSARQPKEEVVIACLHAAAEMNPAAG